MSGFWRAVASPIRLYKRYLSPWLPPACRFEPTCSVYAAEAIERGWARAQQAGKDPDKAKFSWQGRSYVATIR